MGRKSLRPYQQQPGPPLYENQIYPAIESLSLDDSQRYRSEPMIYSSLPPPAAVAVAADVVEQQVATESEKILQVTNFHFFSKPKLQFFFFYLLPGRAGW